MDTLQRLRMNVSFNQIMLPLYSLEQVSIESQEIAILSGYRPENSTPMQCFYSIFQRTNETVNFWTHFIPSWYFLWQLLEMIPNLNNQMYHPLFGYLATVVFYMFTSSFAHALSCLSIRARHTCYFLDYTALSIFSFGSSISYYSYSFPAILKGTRYAEVYLTGCALMSLFCTFTACYSRKVQHLVHMKALRLSAYIFPYAWVNFPLFVKLLRPEEAHLLSAWYHHRQFVAMILAALFYGSHFPEVYAPGKFDFIGNSHNFLHIWGTLATYFQYQGALFDLEACLPMAGRQSGLYDLLIVTVANLAILSAFISNVPPNSNTTNDFDKKS